MIDDDVSGPVEAAQRPAGRRLDTFLDHRSNGLNLVRLVLATSVIFWHAFPLTDRVFPLPRIQQIFGDVAVDGFFAISGFLLAGSWLHHPKVLHFARNRALRIVPAFWVCLLVVGFVLAPLSTALRGGDAGSLFAGPHSAFRYFTDNALLVIHFYDVAGTPVSVPRPGAWNGSLWTLRWEALAYLGLAALGLLGMLRRPRLVLLCYAALWLLLAAAAAGHGTANPDVIDGSRLGFMFLSGSVLQLFGSRIPAGRWPALISLAMVAASVWLPDYRVLGGPFLAYLVVWTGGAIRNRTLQLHNRDVSYGIYIYGFPVQILLSMTDAVQLPAVLFGALALACTAPLAIASWVLVERPMLALKDWRPRTRRSGSGRPEVLAKAR